MFSSIYLFKFAVLLPDSLFAIKSTIKSREIMKWKTAYVRTHFSVWRQERHIQWINTSLETRLIHTLQNNNFTPNYSFGIPSHPKIAPSINPFIFRAKQHAYCDQKYYFFSLVTETKTTAMWKGSYSQVQSPLDLLKSLPST